MDKALYLDIEIQTPKQLEIGLDDNAETLTFTIDGASGGRLPWYEGEYVVDPRKVEQVLETKHKSMRGDVTINPIFYAETSNPSGGMTAVIGLE